MTSTKNGKKKESQPQATHSHQSTQRNTTEVSPYMAHGAVGFVAVVTGLILCRRFAVDAIEQIVGMVLLSGLLYLIMYRDLLRYQPLYVRKRRMLVLLALLVIMTHGLSRLTIFMFEGLMRGLEMTPGDAVFFSVPVMAGAMLVMLLFDFHTAIVFSFVVSLLTGIWRMDPSFTVYAFVGSLTAAFTIIGCKKRTAILRSGLFVLGANLLTALTITLFKGALFTVFVSYALGFAIVSSVLTVAIVSLTLPLFESIFKVTTNITLIELLDLENPLMKNLMIEAPGTYHHSIIVGNLVESCSESVGINPLLARVGAYYHDIGKAKMPEYFIENQPMGISKHDKLTAHMSSMVLISHVKEGVEMARQYKLPEEIVDIIQQHHGNTLITYFYQKAKGEKPNGESPSEDVYRYPGPKPQTRTAALIMMADAVEAASRVLNDPTPARISALVDKIINHIFLAGQLEECELTLKDISQIKSRFTYILTGILHKRIEYPGFDFKGDAAGGTNEGSSKQHATAGKGQSSADKEGYSDRPDSPWV